MRFCNVISIFFLTLVYITQASILASSSSRTIEAESPPEEASPAEKQPERQFGASWFPKLDQKKVKYPVIHFCHTKLEIVFGKRAEIWWTDWKLWVGVACFFGVWFKWLKYGYEEVYWQRGLYAGGINILILHVLQYAGSIKMGMAVVCAWLGAQAVFQAYIWFHSEPREDDDVDFVADTLYLDLSLPFIQIFVLFISQFGVWWFYMTSILGNFHFDEVNYLFWLWSFLVMQMTMIFNRGSDSVLGNPFPVHDVKWLIDTCETGKFVLQDEDGKIIPDSRFEIRKVDMILRGFFGFFCNSILREIMAYTIPLMLMGFSEPMDFVVYCVGVNFICTLDDMHERTYELVDRAGSPREESP